jgi:hypothetical protein
MKNMTSAAGWLFLAVVLAVPSVLFYNWWSNNKAKAALERAQKSNPGAIFPVAEKTALSRQYPAVATPARAVPGMEGGGGGLRASGWQQAKAVVSAQAPKTMESSAGDSPAPVTVSATVALSSAPASSKVRTNSYFNPRLQRDPTISTLEYRRIKEEEDRIAEAERQRLLESKKRVKETNVENKMSLQGIVGDFVIINGERYTVGQTVLGAKILKVGGDYFIAEHKGRQFRKVMR